MLVRFSRLICYVQETRPVTKNDRTSDFDSYTYRVLSIFWRVCTFAFVFARCENILAEELTCYLISNVGV